MEYFDQIEHEERMKAVQVYTDLAIISLLKPKITRDGDRWCVLLGDNVQDGICGFGKTPHEATIDFNQNWYNQSATPGAV